MQLHGTAALQRSGLCATSSRPACPSLVLRPIGLTTTASTLPRGANVLRHAAAAAASLPAPVQQQQQQQQFQQQRLLGEAAASLLASNAAFQLLATVLRACGAVASKAQDALQRMHTAVQESLPQGDDLKALERQLRDSYRGARLMAFFAPLASASADNLSAVYARTFERAAFGFAKMYLFALFMRVLLSWFPSIDWNSNPWTFLRLITEPYLQIYRGILPPLFGQLDFTPLFGFLILQDVVELMSPTYTMGMHARDTSMYWTTTDVMAYFDGH